MSDERQWNILHPIYNRTNWPDRGPWDDEPDKAQWTDEATGLACMVRRNHLGVWCGYVGVAPGHPWYGSTTWDDEESTSLSVHGGITFTDYCADHGGGDGADDPVNAICHVALDGGELHPRLYWFGFDCGHGGDYMPVVNDYLRDFNERFFKKNPHLRNYAIRGHVYRDLAYVQQECRDLAGQLQAVG